MNRLKNTKCQRCGEPIKSAKDRRFTINGGPFHTSCERSSIQAQDFAEPIEPLELLGRGGFFEHPERYHSKPLKVIDPVTREEHTLE